MSSGSLRWWIYDSFIRDYLPRERAILNGVITPSARLFDPQKDYTTHKEITVNAIKRYVGAADRIVEIGSGYGVCTSWAARMATEGEVISYEASSEYVKVASEAVELTGKVIDHSLSSRVTINMG